MTDAEISALVDRMTLEEQVSILSGEDFWSLPAVERLGINKMRVTDGPNGARGGGSLVGGVTAAAFPVGISIGSTWDPALAEEIGSALADEVKSKCAHVSLSPTVNLHRSVTNGRNFECYSEDPELTAALAVGFITGLQKKGVASTIKHFVGNESEVERTTISSVVDERSLRELYLRPFEDAVKKAGTWGIMSSYNKLNGTYTAENDWLLTKVLRDDWGYDGMVVSDWFGSRTTAPTVNAGLDLEMPGPARDRGQKLVDAVANGEVSADTVHERALNMVRLMARVGSINDTSAFAERADNRPEHRALIRRAGAAGSVLLQNDGILPMSADEGTIAVIGPNAKTAQIMGGGSAQLNPHYSVSPWAALHDRLGDDRVSYALGSTNHRWEPIIPQEIDIQFFDNSDLSGEAAHAEKMPGSIAFWFPPFAGGKVDPQRFSARMTFDFTPDADGVHRFGMHNTGLARLTVDGALVVDGWSNWAKGRTFFEEGNDEITGDIALKAGVPVKVVVEFASRPSDNLAFSAIRFGVSRPVGREAIAAAAEVASKADTAVVFVGRTGEWDTEGSDLLDITLPGFQDDLVNAVCDANPNTIVVLQTGGPVEMPWVDRPRAILQSWYPGQEAGNSIADVLFGDQEPTGRLPQTFPARWADNPTRAQDPATYPGKDGQVVYVEGVFTGYRHYERYGLPPLFPFGHGLGYTEFDLGPLTAEIGADGDVTVSVAVTNIGVRRGTTVVQAYVADPDASVERPLRELEGFQKIELDAGETEEISIHLPARAFAYFDVAAQDWRVEAGEFVVSLGFSVVDLRSEVALDLPERRLPV